MNFTEISIHQVGREGQGIGFDLERNLYFVPGALPGDTVRISFPSTAKRYRDAELVEIINRSPERRDPVCPHFAECGGCDWLQWNYEAQLKAKEEMLRHVLQRADLAPRKLLPIRRATTTLGYRSRVQLHRDGARLGFYRRRSHEIVDVADCAVADPKINAAMRDWKSRLPSDEASKTLELRVTREGDVESTWDSRNGTGSFTQIHPEQNEVLKGLVRDAVRRVSAKDVLELYAGDGNLTRAYADDVERVIAVELNSGAVAEGRERAPSHVEFLETAVGPGLYRELPQDFAHRYDTLLLDPPRQGADRSLTRLIHPGLRNIIYISCSPLTFSQNASAILKKRKQFALQRVEPLDMFPHTRHLELIAEFSLS